MTELKDLAGTCMFSQVMRSSVYKMLEDSLGSSKNMGRADLGVGLKLLQESLIQNMYMNK